MLIPSNYIVSPCWQPLSIQLIIEGITKMKTEEKNSEQDQYWSRILKTTELGNYQTGAIVSRTLIDKPVGNVTFFAFDEGQRLSEHTAPFDALVHILDGEAEITIAGQPFSIQADEMIIMPANQPHAVKAVKRFKMLLTMIKG